MLENQQLTLLSQRVRLEVKIEDVTLNADRGKVRLILDNLLSNAIKYSPKGGAIYLSAQADGEQLLMDVADAGPGIPYDERAHIFEAFYTGKAARGTSVKGTGIGLSVVLEFVAAHGGTVQIMDGQFPGAHFRITMPLQTARVKSPRGAAAGRPAPRIRPMPPSSGLAIAAASAARLRAAGRLRRRSTAIALMPPPASVRPPSIGPSPRRHCSPATSRCCSAWCRARRPNRPRSSAAPGVILRRPRPPATSCAMRMILAMPNHPGTDCAKAQQLLQELIATQETLLPAERAMAFVTLQNVDQTLSLTAKIQRLQASADHTDHDRVAALNRRLQSELDENARLHKELDDAHAKLDAIANIERALNKPKVPGGTPQ